MQNNSTNSVKTRAEIAAEYDINVKTLYRWLKEAEIQIKRGRVTPAEQALIYQIFGNPNKKPKKKS